MSDVLLASCLIAFAASIQSLAGFGFGMVAMATLASILPVHGVVPIVALLGMVTGLSVLFTSRRALRWVLVAPLLAGGLVGVPIGVQFFKSATPTLLTATLGIVLVLYAVHGLWRGDALPKSTRLSDRSANGVGTVAALIGGVLGGAFNVGGPPVVMYVAWRRLDPAATRATLQCFFCVATALQLTLFAVDGRLTQDVLIRAAAGLPAIALGLVVGTAVAKRVSRAVFGRVVLVLLLVLGVRFLVA